VSSYAPHFSRFLGAVPGRLHVAAHSHHPWPDVTLEAHQQAWLDAALLADDKWDRVFGQVMPEAAGHIAGRLGLSDPDTIAFAPSTHALVVRLLSCLPSPARILTSDAEFHSFTRQSRRLEEDGRATVERVAAEPFESFPERLVAAAGRGGHDLVFFSHVLFNSGYVLPDPEAVVAAVPDDSTFVVVDGYHGFMAVPTDFRPLERRAFYLAGGYKYAMAGEGACFAHCPPGYAARPLDTGWFAGFGDLAGPAGGSPVGYPAGGARFLGGTFDPTGLYRLNAVQRWLDGLGLSVEDIHAHTGRLQALFLKRLGDLRSPLAGAELLPPASAADRGHFLTFRLPGAGTLYAALHRAGVVTDHRHDRLRFGFGIYHDDSDVDELCRRLEAVRPRE
jgi:selenocysteine lyase/cysteine desulfurase